MAVELEDWLPMWPNMGPPLPRFMGIYWPWAKPGVAAEEVTPPTYAGVAKFAYVSAIRHYKQYVNVDPGMGGGTTKYEVFEVDIQNQGGITALCSAIASCRYWVKPKGEAGRMVDYQPFYYDQYASNNALALKVDSAYIGPGEIVTFREALWPYAYQDADASWIQVKFSGEAGEIISETISI